MESFYNKPFEESDNVSDMSENKSHCATDNRRDESHFDAIIPVLYVIIGELGVIIGFLFTHFFLHS